MEHIVIGGDIQGKLRKKKMRGEHRKEEREGREMRGVKGSGGEKRG